MPHVPVASGAVLHTRDEACVARACCDNGSLLFTVQELQLRFDPRMQLVPFVSLLFRSACVVASVCTRAALQGTRFSWHIVAGTQRQHEHCDGAVRPGSFAAVLVAVGDGSISAAPGVKASRSACAAVPRKQRGFVVTRFSVSAVFV